jgi:hypothetical protein
MRHCANPPLATDVQQSDESPWCFNVDLYARTQLPPAIDGPSIHAKRHAQKDGFARCGQAG